MPLCLKAAISMKDYYPAVPRYGRCTPRLRASRTVRFPNDVVFQDHIKQGDLEQVGRFIRARKVTLDTIYPSGECCWSAELGRAAAQPGGCEGHPQQNWSKLGPSARSSAQQGSGAPGWPQHLPSPAETEHTAERGSLAPGSL